jgi:hypothetical protein
MTLSTIVFAIDSIGNPYACSAPYIASDSSPIDGQKGGQLFYHLNLLDPQYR